MSNGKIAVDLDGTLAYHGEWKGASYIGDPIPLMQAKVLSWLEMGVNVVIFTARVSSNNPDKDIARIAIKAWCIKHLKRELPITAEKTMDMIAFYDDRARQVVPNKGLVVGEDIKI